ncbi:MAG: lecithin--cholesterol acyltransferase, partial [Gemmatimonadota bacterium]
TFGTPYRGSVQAIDYLANGCRKLIEIKVISDLARSFTAMYQLLPIYQVLRAGGRWQRVAETDGIPNIDRARAADALAFHREIEKAVEERRATPAADAYQLIPFVGTAQDTLLSAELNGDKVTTSTDLPSWIDAGLGEGDGTVPRLSAIPIELDDASESYLAVRHGSIQQHPQVLDDLFPRLERMQAPNLGAIRGVKAIPEVKRPSLSLDVDDIFAAGEPVVVRARVKDAARPPQGVVARLGRADQAGRTATHPMQQADDGWRVTLEGLEPGLYRVEVQTRPGGRRAALPIQELFEVATSP